MGVAALTPWGAAMYGPASAQFQAAALFAATAIAAGAAAHALASSGGGASAAATTGYQEATGAGIAGGASGIAREAEPQQAAQQINVTIIGEFIRGEEAVEEALLPVLKKIGDRDTEISISYRRE